MSESYLASGPSASIAQDIGRAIRDGELQPGERLTPIRALASRYGVSFGAARNAVAMLENQGLVYRRQGSGTYVADQPSEATGNQQVYLMLRSRDHLYSHLFENLVERLQEAGCMAVRIGWVQDRGLEQLDNILNVCRQQPPRALVTQWEVGGLDELLDSVAPANVARIATFRRRESLPRGWSSVNPNRSMACELAIEHVLSRQQERIGVVIPAVATNPMESTAGEGGCGVTPECVYMRTLLSKAGVTTPLQVHHNLEGPGKDCDPMWSGNTERLCEWLSSPQRPTAVVGDDFCVMAVKVAAEHVGLRVPDDLFVVGFGNTPWAEVGGFSSVCYRVEAIAARIAELVMLPPDEDEVIERHILVAPRLVERA